LILICIFKPYIVNECFVDIKREEVGFHVSLKPVEIEIIYSQKKKEKVQPSEEIFPTQYSPPFIEHKIITNETESPISESIPEVKPVVTVKDITSCKTQLNNRITEINSIKNKHITETQDLLLNREMYDQRIASQNGEIVQKYKSYKEVRIMMSKLKIMLKTEVSENRKTKQLNSFVSLLKGKVELEEVLKEKLGLPYEKKPVLPQSLGELEKLDVEIESLTKKLSDTEIKIPKGMSTRDERFLLK
jgi:hypothetical protein